MSISESIVPEFDAEMASTRKVLERVPDDKLQWKAHPKSNTIAWLAAHLAEIPGWVEGTLTQDFWDVRPVGGEAYQSPIASSREETLRIFDKNVAEARNAILATADEEYAKLWSLKEAGETIMTLPKGAVIRTFILNHTIHHRAIMCVYLRLNDVPVPGMYGPSGDE